jgi:hypothetical protein
MRHGKRRLEWSASRQNRTRESGTKITNFGVLAVRDLSAPPDRRRLTLAARRNCGCCRRFGHFICSVDNDVETFRRRTSMAIRTRKRMRAKKPASARVAARIKRASHAVSTRTLVVAVAAVFGAAVVIGAATSGGSRDRAVASSPSPKPATPASNAPATASAAEAPIPPVGVPAAMPVATSGRSGSVTTITGCLAREDAAYKLKDTSGDAAPRARSWKSGFLKKGTAPIELYDSANRAKLPTHVGQRISVTGELIDREMYVRSLQRVSTSCATKS